MKKNKKSIFEPHFTGLRGNICTPSIARWKARGRLCIRRNWTFLAISYGWDVISENQSKSAFFEGGGLLWAQISDGRGITHQPLLVSENYSDCRFVWYQNIRSPSFSFVTIHASDGRTDSQTDGQTDRHTELQQYRALHYMRHDKNRLTLCRLCLGLLHARDIHKISANFSNILKSCEQI